MQNFIVGTFTKSKEDADRRDYRIEDLLQADGYTVNTIPKSFSWRKNIAKSYYQNGRGSCTSLGGTHCMQEQNIEELINTNQKQKDAIYNKILKGDNIINLDRKDLWTKMGHNLDDKNDSGDYVENMLKTLKDKGIKGIDINGKEIIYFADGFAYANTPFTSNSIKTLKLNITKSPLVFSIRGNSNTRNEMMNGRVTTVLTSKDFTGGHCIAMDGYTEQDGEFINSWRPNDVNNNICSFKIDWKTFMAMVKTGMINWRYWNILDRKTVVVDLELYNKKQEAIVTILQNRKMYEKGDTEDKKKYEQRGISNYLKLKYNITEEELKQEK